MKTLSAIAAASFAFMSVAGATFAEETKSFDPEIDYSQYPEDVAATMRTLPFEKARQFPKANRYPLAEIGIDQASNLMMYDGYAWAYVCGGPKVILPIQDKVAKAEFEKFSHGQVTLKDLRKKAEEVADDVSDIDDELPATGAEQAKLYAGIIAGGRIFYQMHVQVNDPGNRFPGGQLMPICNLLYDQSGRREFLEAMKSGDRPVIEFSF